MKLKTIIFLIATCYVHTTSSKLFILIGPSGVGKTTLATKLIEMVIPIEYLVTHTTRPMRPGEIDGKDYHFVTQQDFATKQQRDEFITTTTMYGNSYGICRNTIQSKLADHCNIIACLNADVAQKLKDFWNNDVIAIFITPPSLEALKNRLSLRLSEDDVSLQKRINGATYEMQMQDSFDYKIVNDNLEQAVDALHTIFLKKSRRT